MTAADGDAEGQEREKGELGKGHSTHIAIREEIQFSTVVQLSWQQLNTSEVSADGICCHPVPWLSQLPQEPLHTVREISDVQS